MVHQSGGSDFRLLAASDVPTVHEARLANARISEPLGDGWTYGTDAPYLKALVAYWRDRFDWRAQERRLNRLPQFKTNIDGLDIHFLHVRSKNPGALALLLLNGWPSTIDEYSKVIGPLTDPVSFGGRAEDSFDVVIPSMPGFGFSDKPRERGFGTERIAAVWTQLMARLGYTKYGTQGTDIGSGVGAQLAVVDAAHMAGLHHRLRRRRPGRRHGDDGVQLRAEHEAADDWL